MTDLPLPINTERLRLRGFVIDDLDDVYAYQRLPEVARFLYRDPRSLERTREMLAEDAALRFAQEGDALVLAVEAEGSTRVIGEMMLRWTNQAAMQAELGYVFHPSVAGRGYATEAGRAVLELAFGHLGFHRVFARLDEENTASGAVCRRLGMRQEARLVESDKRGTVWGTELVYAMLRREWAGGSL